MLLVQQYASKTETLNCCSFVLYKLKEKAVVKGKHFLHFLHLVFY